MNRLVFTLVLCFQLAVAPVAQAGPKDTLESCRKGFVSLVVKTAKGTREFLANRGLWPYKYGDEAHAIEAVPTIEKSTWILAGRQYAKTRRKFLGAMKATKNWERAGSEVEYGTYVEKPTYLVGKTVAALLKDEAGLWKSGSVRTVVGKVINVVVSKKSKSTGEALQFELQIQTPTGMETHTLPGLRELHSLNLDTQSTTQYLLQLLKSTVEQAGSSLKKYAGELRRHPIRILIRPRDLESEKEYPAKGFLRKESSEHGTTYWLFHPIEYVFYRTHGALRERARKKGAEIPPEDFQYFLVPAPVRGLRHHTLTKGFSALVSKLAKRYEEKVGMSPETRELFDKPMEPSALVNTVVSMALFYGLYAILNSGNDQVLVDRREEILDEQKDEWLKELERDYLLRMVKRKLARGEYGEDDADGEAVEEAFLRLHALDNYYYYMMAHHRGKDDLEETNEVLLEDGHTRILFPEVAALKESGPEPSGNLKVPPDQQKPATKEQIAQVMDAYHRFLDRRPLIQAMARSETDLAKILGDRSESRRSRYQQVYREMAEDPYFRSLMERKEQGDLSPERFEYLMMEAADVDRRFASWDVFDAVPYVDGKAVSREEFRRNRLGVEESEGSPLTEVELAQAPPFDHNHMISRYGGDLTKIHMLRQTSPILQSTGFLGNYVARGRQYRGAVNGQSARLVDVMRPDGSVGKRVQRAPLFPEFFKVFSRGVIVYDVAARTHQYLRVDDEIRASLENPYASSRGNQDEGRAFMEEVLHPTEPEAEVATPAE